MRSHKAYNKHDTGWAKGTIRFFLRFSHRFTRRPKGTRARALLHRARHLTPRSEMLTITFFLLGIGGVVAGCLYHESRRHAAACEQEEIDSRH